jgi:CMP-N-acetylneuraminic acid synthetase
VPRKNVRPLAGKPLLVYTAEVALASRRLARAVLTTDDPTIAEVGRAAGLETPFLRPAELALDETPMLPVVRHALSWFERRGERFDAVCLLQPTSPLRTAADVDACIDLLVASGADSVVTVLPIPAEHNPHWAYVLSEDGFLRLSTGEAAPIARRQDLPAAFHREGSVYVTCRDVVMEENSLYGARVAAFRLDERPSVNIDTAADWARAETLLTGGRYR